MLFFENEPCKSTTSCNTNFFSTDFKDFPSHYKIMSRHFQICLKVERSKQQLTSSFMTSSVFHCSNHYHFLLIRVM